MDPLEGPVHDAITHAPQHGGGGGVYKHPLNEGCKRKGKHMLLPTRTVEAILFSSDV